MATAATRRLVFFTDCPYFGGAEGYVAMLAEAPPDPSWQLAAMVPAGEGGAVLAERLAAAGVEVLRYPLHPSLSPRLWRVVSDGLRRLRGEILHLNLPSVYDARLSVPALIAKRLGYRRVVTTEHLPMVPRARRCLVIKTLLSPAIDAIIVHTRWNRDQLARYHHMPRRKMVVIPNGSPEPPQMSEAERAAQRRALGVTDQELALTVVARLTARKGHRFLLEALAQIDRQQLAGGRRWRLLVVGEGEERENLARLAADQGLDGRVAFLGYREDARAIIHVSDLLLLPALLESQPLVLTEAMASGRPVLATRIYGIPEIVTEGETGLLVPPGESEALAREIGRLLRDDRLREQLGRQGRARYEAGFTLGHMAARTYAVLAG